MFNAPDPITPSKVVRLYHMMSDRRVESGLYENCDEILKGLARAYEAAKKEDHDNTRFWIRVVICLMDRSRQQRKLQ
jgi:hypothetical protein